MNVGRLIAIAIAIIAVAAIVLIVRFPHTLQPEADAHIEKLGIDLKGIHVRMPCAGVFDTGFIVNYRKLGSRVDRVGRLCRGLTGGPWTWHPDTNDLREVHVLNGG